MSKYQDDFKRGVTEMLVLSLLSKKDLYGYQITQTITGQTGGVYTLLEGTLYPILYRLEDAGCIESYNVTVGKRRRRKFYRIKEKGRAQLEEMLRDYRIIGEAVEAVLEGGVPGDGEDEA